MPKTVRETKEILAQLAKIKSEREEAVKVFTAASDNLTRINAQRKELAEELQRSYS
jgi:chromosome segregation ATPase